MSLCIFLWFLQICNTYCYITSFVCNYPSLLFFVKSKLWFMVSGMGDKDNILNCNSIDFYHSFLIIKFYHYNQILGYLINLDFDC